MDNDKYSQLIRVLGLGAAIFMWVVSVLFSSNGFGTFVPGFEWIGVGLAVSVTVLQLIFLEEGGKHTLTLFMAGIGAYTYSIVTDVVGFWAMRGNLDPMKNLGTLAFVIIISAAVEFIPEPLFEYCLTGQALRDIFSSVLGEKKKDYQRGGSGYPRRETREF